MARRAYSARATRTVAPLGVKQKAVQPYTDDERAYLVEAFHAGLSATETARMLFRKFNRDASRAAIGSYWRNHDLHR